MPYVSPERRAVLDKWGTWGADTMGDLTYVLTNDILDYLAGHDESFQTYGEILGALEATKLELYRRRVAKYEDCKLLDNGDVY